MTNTTNKNKALEYYDLLMAAGDSPLLVAYWKDNDLLLCRLNHDALVVWGFDQETYQTELDQTIYRVFDRDSHKIIQSQATGDVELIIDCIGKDKTIKGRMHWHSWGLWLRFKPKFSINLPTPTALEGVLSAWVSLGETGRKLVGIISGVLGVSFGALNVGNLIGTAKITNEQIQAVLENQYSQYPSPKPNAIIYWEYDGQLSSRTLKVKYPNSILNASRDIEFQDVQEHGWYQMLSDHKAGKPHAIRKEYYDQFNDGRHAISRTLGRYNVEVVVSAPIKVGAQGEVLKGYVSVGYQDNLSWEDEKNIKKRLEVTAGILGNLLD